MMKYLGIYLVSFVSESKLLNYVFNKSLTLCEMQYAVKCEYKSINAFIVSKNNEYDLPAIVNLILWTPEKH